MGVVNVTPDSFSDGGAFDRHRGGHRARRRARRRGRRHRRRGRRVDAAGRRRRCRSRKRRRACCRCVRALAGAVTVSVDTYKADVAAAALDAGAEIVNDVSGGTLDPELLRVVAGASRLRHPRTPARHAGTRCRRTRVMTDVVREVVRELAGAVRRARVAAGVAESRILVDPGLGFAKTGAHNLALLRAARRAAGARLPDRRRRVAQVVPRHAHRARGRRSRAGDGGGRHRGHPARRQRRARARRARAAGRRRRRRCDRARAQARGGVAHEAARLRLFHSLTVREGLIAAVRHPHRLLRHLPHAAAHQGHARGADAHRHRARRRRLLRRQAARADDACRGCSTTSSTTRSSSSSSSSSTTSAAASCASGRTCSSTRGPTSRPSCSRRSSRRPSGWRTSRVGALIVLERDADLVDYLNEPGVEMDAKVSEELLVSLFLPDSENKLHDGAVIIKNLRIAQAGAVLPLSANAQARQGARHAPPRRHRHHRGDRRGRRRRVRGARLDLALLRRQHRPRPRRRRRCARRCSACSRSRSGARRRRSRRSARCRPRSRRCRSRSRSRPRRRDSAPIVARPTVDDAGRSRRTRKRDAAVERAEPAESS